MRLLIISQKIDKDDTVLGFFHGWLEKFAREFEKVYVVANYVGNYDLPNNVSIFSLGKEKHYSKIRKYFLFYRLMFGSIKKVDAIFFHMCPEYVLAGWILNVVFRKKSVLWYVHKKVNWKLKLAEKMVDKIFTVSRNSINLASKKVVPAGHGINLDFFKKMDNVKVRPRSLLYFGRISPVKNIEKIIEAAVILGEKTRDFSLDIVGNPVNKGDAEYKEKLENLASEKIVKKRIRFLPAVAYKESPYVLNFFEILVNLTSVGSFDKVILEAMACEKLVLVANGDFKKILPEICLFDATRAENLSDKMFFLLNLDEESKKKYGKIFRQYVFENHNLDNLIKNLHHEFER